MPAGLRHLSLAGCQLMGVPLTFSRLVHLTTLNLANNTLQASGWQGHIWLPFQGRDC